MVYDPNNPNPQIPGGMAATTSVPGGAGMPQTNPGVRAAPVPGGAPASPGFSMPSLPGGAGARFGQMPSIPGLPTGGGTTPLPTPGPGTGPASQFGGGQFNKDGLMTFIDNYKNSLFQWLSSRPQDPTAMGDWRTTRPQFDAQGLMAAMFAPPPAPATAPATTPAPVTDPALTPQTHTFVEPPLSPR